MASAPTLFDRWFSRTLYVCLSPERVTVKDLKTQAVVDEVPDLAIHWSLAGKTKVLAVGTAARSKAEMPGIEIVNPFSHPRTVIPDFVMAEQVLKVFVQRVGGTWRWLRSRPVMVLHPVGEHLGGLTPIELRALQELAMAAGARKASVWQGPDLTDDEIVTGNYPVQGRMFTD